MGLIDLVLVLLAAYRLSDMLADPQQEGPYKILMGFRNLVGVYYDEYSSVQGRTSFARGLLCQYCNSVWIGFLFTLVVLVLIYLSIPVWIVFLPLGISGFVVLLKEFTNV
jgi:hypothetical protein